MSDKLKPAIPFLCEQVGSVMSANKGAYNSDIEERCGIYVQELGMYLNSNARMNEKQAYSIAQLIVENITGNGRGGNDIFSIWQTLQLASYINTCQ